MQIGKYFQKYGVVYGYEQSETEMYSEKLGIKAVTDVRIFTDINEAWWWVAQDRNNRHLTNKTDFEHAVKLLRKDGRR